MAIEDEVGVDLTDVFTAEDAELQTVQAVVDGTLEDLKKQGRWVAPVSSEETSSL